MFLLVANSSCKFFICYFKSADLSEFPEKCFFFFFGLEGRLLICEETGEVREQISLSAIGEAIFIVYTGGWGSIRPFRPSLSPFLDQNKWHQIVEIKDWSQEG